MLYSGNKATESKGGGRVPAGPYKFKIVESKHYASNHSIGFRMKLWEGEAEVTDKMWHFIKLDGKPAMLAETDRVLTTLLGKSEIKGVDELLSKTGWVVIRNGARGGEVIPWGGFYNSNKLSASGNDTMTKRIEEALAYDWTQDQYAVAQEAKRAGASAPSQANSADEDMPF